MVIIMCCQHLSEADMMFSDVTAHFYTSNYQVKPDSVS